MELEIIIPIIAFLLFALVSPLIKKLRGTPDESKLQRRHPSRDIGADDPFEEEIDLSEWEVSSDLPNLNPNQNPLQSSRKYGASVPSLKQIPDRNSKKCRASVPSPKQIPGPEFQEVQGKRPVSDQSSYTEGKTPFIRSSETQTRIRPKRKKRRMKLDFDPSTIRKAIIYNEIIGPPRAESDYFKNP